MSERNKNRIQVARNIDTTKRETREKGTKWRNKRGKISEKERKKR
jgi:hypothetical protein